jgi:hypothetical protein
MAPDTLGANHERGSGTSDAHGLALTLGRAASFDRGFDGHAGNFNPEWGYIAPAPNFLRTARVFIVVAAIGATASAAVVFALMDRPAAETSVAARTLVQPVELARTAPLVAQLQTQSEQTSVLQAQHSVLEAQRPDAAGAIRPQGTAGSRTRVRVLP